MLRTCFIRVMPFTFCLIFLASFPALAQPKAQPPGEAEPEATAEQPQQESDVASLMEKAADKYKQRSKIEAAREAIDLWEKVLAEQPDNKQALAMLGRAYWWVGINTDGEENKIKIHQKGIDYSERLLKLDPSSVPGHYWFAVNSGKLGEAKGIMKSLSLLGPIKDHMAEVLRLDRTYEGGGYYRVMGNIQLKVPRLLGGGTEEQAIESFREAVKIDPDKLWNHLYLAQAYLKDDQDEEAKAELEWIINAPNEPGYYAESVLNKQDAKKLLAENFGK